MAMMNVLIKIMPNEPGLDYANKIIDILSEKLKGLDEIHLNDYKIEPVAFGLYSIIALFRVSESDEQAVEKLENLLKSIDLVSSVQIIGMTRL